jgi:predicted RNA-binding Zn-ribbon protein involved in translation (DUF1610 family)
MTDQNHSSWWACPTCGGETRICRGKNVATTRECTDCDWSVTLEETEDVDSDSDSDEDDSDEGDASNDVAEVLKMIPPLFDSDAPTEDRLQGALVFGTLIAVVGFWVYLTVI